MSRAIRSIAPALVAAASLASAPARGDGPRFGERGSVVFGGDLGLGGQQGLDQGYDTGVSLELDPALDVFVASGLSLGTAVVMSWTVARQGSGSSSVAMSPRVGYAMLLGARWALWPRASVDFVSGAQGQPGGDTLHSRVLSTSLYAPLDAFLLPHLAVGLGPQVTQELLHRTDAGTGPRTTTAQLLLEIAGWL